MMNKNITITEKNIEINDNFKKILEQEKKISNCQKLYITRNCGRKSTRRLKKRIGSK